MPDRGNRVTKAQILEQSCKSTYDFCFGQMVTLTDSPKFILTVCMDAFQPFLGQYYQVRLLHLVCVPGARSNAQPCDLGTRPGVSGLAISPPEVNHLRVRVASSRCTL